jgi:hypothetical protein
LIDRRLPSCFRYMVPLITLPILSGCFGTASRGVSSAPTTEQGIVGGVDRVLAGGDPSQFEQLLNATPNAQFRDYSATWSIYNDTESNPHWPLWQIICSQYATSPSKAVDGYLNLVSIGVPVPSNVEPVSLSSAQSAAIREHWQQIRVKDEDRFSSIRKMLDDGFICRGRSIKELYDILSVDLSFQSEPRTNSVVGEVQIGKNKYGMVWLQLRCKGEFPKGWIESISISVHK